MGRDGLLLYLGVLLASILYVQDAYVWCIGVYARSKSFFIISSICVCVCVYDYVGSTVLDSLATS